MDTSNLDQEIPTGTLHLLLSEAFGWPDGVREQCEALAAAHPRWTVYYSPGGPHAQGFYAFVTGAKDDRVLYAAAPESLADVITNADRRANMRLWNGVRLT
jgi:hypothetical protein